MRHQNGGVDAREDRDASRQEIATRYARWVSERMREKDWTPAQLARRSGLLKQQISDILAGRASQPTVAQVSALGRAFRISPTEIFRQLGFWQDPDGVRPQELGRLYQSMDFIERRAFLRIGHVLLDAQQEYAALLRQPPKPQPPAVQEPILDDIPDEPQAAFEPIPPEMLEDYPGDEEDGDG